MKLTYIAPLVEISEIQTEQMMALSLQQGAADGSDVLVKDNADWNIWEED